MTSFIEWMNAFPSRWYALGSYLICVVLVWLRCYAEKQATTKRRSKRFVFCGNGRKSNVLWVELVTQYEFDHYQKLVGYAVIDMNSSSIYFAVND